MPLLHIAANYAINLIETVEIKMTRIDDGFTTYNVLRNNGVYGSETSLVHTFKTRFDADCYAELQNKNISDDEPVCFFVEVVY